MRLTSAAGQTTSGASLLHLGGVLPQFFIRETGVSGKAVRYSRTHFSRKKKFNRL